MDTKVSYFKNCSVKHKGFRVTISDITQSLSALACCFRLVLQCLSEGCQADRRANHKAPNSCCLVLLFYFLPYSWGKKEKKQRGRNRSSWFNAAPLYTLSYYNLFGFGFFILKQYATKCKCSTINFFGIHFVWLYYMSSICRLKGRASEFMKYM